MASKYNIDLTGRKFGKLTAVKGLDDYTVNNGCKGYQKWECVCECGVIINTTSFDLLRNRSSSCGIKGCGRSRGREQSVPDMLNKKYGNLTVVKLLDERKSGSRYWLCKCDCGNYKKVKTCALKKIKSCGCLNIIYKDRTLPAAKDIYKNYKEKAKKRNLEFDLSFEEFLVLTKLNCFYCGDIPKNCRKTNTEYNNISEFTYNGIDRVNNSIGYVKGNIVSCCFMCNSAKKDRTIKEFLDWITKFKKDNKNG